MRNIRNWFNNLFIGRQGMDELSKAMFWWGLAGLLLSGLTASLLNGVLASLLSWLGLLLICTAYLVDGSFSPFLYFRF